MSTWELLSLVLVAAVVGMFSGPWAALKGTIRTCGFEVFVELVDRMNWSMAHALTVLLPAAFLSLCFVTLMNLDGFPKLFVLNLIALILFSTSLLIAALFEVPIVKKIAAWPGDLTVPEDWRAIRSRWLRIHLLRVALGFGSLISLLVAAGVLYATP